MKSNESRRSPARTFIAAGSQDAVYLDAPARRLRALPKGGFDIENMAFDPAGSLVALWNSDHGGAVIDLLQFKLVWRWQSAGTQQVQFGTRGDQLYIEEPSREAPSQRLRIFSVSTWRESQPIPLPFFDVLRIEPSGGRIAVEHRDKTSRARTPPDLITLFSARDGSKSETFHLSGLPEAKLLQFSVYEKWPMLRELSTRKPEAWYLDRNGSDVKVIDRSRANGGVAALPHDQEPSDSAIAITGNHRWAATSTVGKTIYLWPLDPTIVLEKACKSFLPRNLTAQEFDVFRIPEKYRFPACPNLTDKAYEQH
jgi:hypothetical protein